MLFYLTTMMTRTEYLRPDLNRALAKAYSYAWESIVEVYRLYEDRELTMPHLVRAPDRYNDQRSRLMVVGQQTGGWHEQHDVSSVNPSKLMNWHSEFDLAENKKVKKSPFWQIAHKINTALNVSTPPAFIWSNLIKLAERQKAGGKYGKPTTEIRDAIREARLLQLELEILKPNVVVFFTGPTGYYTWELKQQFPGICIEGAHGYDTHILAKLNHDLLPEHTYRSYHPTALNRRSTKKHKGERAGLEVIDSLIELIVGS